MLPKIPHASFAPAVLIASLLAFGGMADGAAAADTLRLRVNRAIAEPGEVVAVVLRTYAPRPISQGQVCLRFRSLTLPPGVTGGEPTPFAEMLGAAVFSSRGDAESRAVFEERPTVQIAMIEFLSPSASVNDVDGPLAVFYFRLRPDLPPGQRFKLKVDAFATELYDAGGRPITIEPRRGGLLVRWPGGRRRVQAEGDRVVPGEVAELGVDTFEPVALGLGQVGLRYDPSAAAAPPAVTMDPRYGNATYAVDTSTPGLLLVSFASADGSLNRLPGRLVGITLPTSGTAVPGTASRLRLDPDLTHFFDPLGRALRLRLKNAWLEFEAPD